MGNEPLLKNAIERMREGEIWKINILICQLLEENIIHLVLIQWTKDLRKQAQIRGEGTVLPKELFVQIQFGAFN